MDAAPASGGGGGPAPFLIKTYEMVDDSSTDEIVSWSSNNRSFVVWNPPEFSRLLLPAYFKHNNFSSFIRQLNTYGFRKSDPERWEFANEEFIKDQKHLLRNIHRRKPIHSHSHPQNSSVNPERAALSEEIERLSHEKKALEVDILRYKQQLSAPKLQLEDLTQRVRGLEHRQESILTCIESSIHNQTFIEYLAQKIESMDFSAYNKKRRLPQLDHAQPAQDCRSVDERVSCRPDSGIAVHQDSSNNLNLGLSPAVSDINLVSSSTQSSEDFASPPQKKMLEEEQQDAEVRTCGVSFAPGILDLSDTGKSFNFKFDSSLSRKARANERTNPQQSSQKSWSNTEENDDLISCHLNLTLASAPLRVAESCSAKITQLGLESGASIDSKCDSEGKDAELIDLPNKDNSSDVGRATLTRSSEAVRDTAEKPPAAPVRVNDVFWEQFLTEKPGSSDTEEADSKVGVCSYDQEDGRCGHGMSRNTKNMQQLTL